jgi:hypothetical protein
VSKTRIRPGDLFVLIRVISWIVLFMPLKRAIHELTRNAATCTRNRTKFARAGAADHWQLRRIVSRTQVKLRACEPAPTFLTSDAFEEQLSCQPTAIRTGTSRDDKLSPGNLLRAGTRLFTPNVRTI